MTEVTPFGCNPIAIAFRVILTYVKPANCRFPSPVSSNLAPIQFLACDFSRTAETRRESGECLYKSGHSLGAEEGRGLQKETTKFNRTLKIVGHK